MAKSKKNKKKNLTIELTKEPKNSNQKMEKEEIESAKNSAPIQTTENIKKKNKKKEHKEEKNSQTPIQNTEKTNTVTPEKKSKNQKKVQLPQQTPQEPETIKKPNPVITHIRNAKYLKTLAIGTITVAALVGVVEAAAWHSSDRIYPNTEISGIKLGYKPTEEARKELKDKVISYLKTPLTFQSKDQTVKVTPEEFAVRFNQTELNNLTQPYIFSQDSIASLASSLFTTKSENLTLSYDKTKLQKILDQKFKLSEKRAKNAALTIKDKNIVVIPEQNGQKIDLENVEQQLAANFKNLESTEISVQYQKEEATVKASDLEKSKDQILAVLKQPITLHTTDKSFTFKASENLDLISFEKNNDKKTEANAQTNSKDTQNKNTTDLKITINQEKADTFFQEKILKDVEIPAEKANIYTDKDNKVIVEGIAKDGITVDKNNFYQSLEKAFTTGNSKVEVPLIKEKAKITVSKDLQDQGVKELIATGHSAFAGSSANRVFNINLGVSKFPGVLVKPGEEFSFNKNVGEVDGKHGFKAEKVIKQNKIEMDWGGGLCQVSTTLYRAALLAGLPITERAPHSWKVAYYSQVMGNGLDATVYTGVRDLKFVNDTPGSLIIQGYTNGVHAYFLIYGTNDNRKVELDGPYGAGLNYKWTRTITKENSDPVKETIVSNYKPIPTDANTPAKPATQQ